MTRSGKPGQTVMVGWMLKILLRDATARRGGVLLRRLLYRADEIALGRADAQLRADAKERREGHAF